MIRASEAKFKSEHQKEIDDIFANIEKEINKAISNGEFTCISTIPVDTEQAVRDEIAKQMMSLGYKIIVPKKMTYAEPCEQAPWYNNITICWE